MNATESSNVITNDANGKTSTFEQHVDEILNQINSSDTVFSKVDQKVDNITIGDFNHPDWRRFGSSECDE